VLKVIFVDRQQASSSWRPGGEVDLLQRGTLLVLAATILLLGIIPQVLVGPIVRALP
jgi:hypothetical protein